MTTKPTSALAPGDTVVKHGRIVMTVQKTAPAVSRWHTVVWFTGPRGGAHVKGFLSDTLWEVHA